MTADLFTSLHVVRGCIGFYPTIIKKLNYHKINHHIILIESLDQEIKDASKKIILLVKKIKWPNY